jgi:hypothetical protein
MEQANTLRAGGGGESFVVGVRRLTRPIENEARFGLPGMFVIIDEENVTNVFGMDMGKMFCDARFCPLPFEGSCQILHVATKSLYKPVRTHQQGREPRRNEGENDIFVID